MRMVFGYAALESGAAAWRHDRHGSLHASPGLGRVPGVVPLPGVAPGGAVRVAVYSFEVPSLGSRSVPVNPCSHEHTYSILIV